VLNKKGKILVADDEASLRLLLSKELSRAGYTVDVVTNGAEAMQKIAAEYYHIVLLDIVMPKKDGIDVLRYVRAENIPTEVVILTGNATIESAIECMKLGAYDYVRKPYSLNELLIQIQRAIEHQRSKIDLKIMREDLRKSGYGGNIVGKSEKIRELRDFISRVAPTQSTVLILGESGTGKELVARSIHEQSLHNEKAFVTINCASLSETLLESELFGYEKGAFTDAKSQKRGLAEIADGGTLFLDEIGEIPIHFQAKLLRFLETGEIRRVGGTHDIRLSVRIICATNKPLEELVAQKEFRDDLYYRLNVLSIHVPPLRNHLDDIPLLVDAILASQSQQRTFDKSACDVLSAYEWPGNVRELRNVVERTCILCPDKIITADQLSFLGGERPLTRAQQPAEEAVAPEENSFSIKDMERRHIIRILRQTGGHKRRAAKMLEINPKTLYQKMQKYKIVSEYK
jgi:two-component system, NtrC family, response regulator AtoC